MEYEPIIVIGSAEVSHTPDDPFTAGERYLMISESLRSAGIRDFAIIPVMNVNRFGIWVSHVRTLVPPFDIVISNNSLTRRLFSEYGHQVQSPKRYSRDVYQGTHIRSLMISGGPWEELVPQTVAATIMKFDGIERLHDLSKHDKDKGGP